MIDLGPIVPSSDSNQKRKEADHLWEQAKACESSGGNFNSKTKEMQKIKEHIDKAGGVRRDPDRGELTSREWINKKIKYGSQHPTE